MEGRWKKNHLLYSSPCALQKRERKRKEEKRGKKRGKRQHAFDCQVCSSPREKGKGEFKSRCYSVSRLHKEKRKREERRRAGKAQVVAIVYEYGSSYPAPQRRERGGGREGRERKKRKKK